ncbi:Era [Desulforapulum autotrophicum HRM2]|uniref:GTPase Era n=1 Tax=Desulforapulum autotrophicum (strain ATCC 43914 / DSM 3382 / VKM B-1955 / HRM2) TaxID=177437 RepID=C0QLA4_DESAH|nr:GTPase Era [Desulforapulum autotrophicum]ACN14190.1 Era [Desulforapulum autotrophicum HRM2]
MIKDTPQETDFKAGFIAIVGAPNAGKSTLLNTVLGQKISITSKKPQTTRDRILGVVERPGAQIIFVDTPGIHRAHSLLNKKIVDQALSAVDDVDAVLLMIDVTSKDTESEALIIEQLQKRNKAVVLALNKIDLVKSNEILPLIARYASLHEFKAVIPVSAKTGDQTEKLLAEVQRCLPPGQRLFPKDTLTDVSQRFIAGEMIREKVFRLTGMEIPYSIAVTVDAFKETPRLTEIHATIHVDRDSQKGIIIGKGGQMLKQIGAKARMDIQRMTGTKVMLKLFVRVTKNWSRDERIMKEFGY